MTKAEEIAQWMYAEILAKKHLYQDATAEKIHMECGESFASFSDAGNLIISKQVLSSFKKLSASNVLWDGSQKLWRLRETYDQKGRRV